MENPSQSYGASLATWDHTVLPATWHKWMRPTITPANLAGTRFTYPGRMEGWVDLGSPIAAQPRIEPTTAWSQVRRSNRYATESPCTSYTCCCAYYATHQLSYTIYSELHKPYVQPKSYNQHQAHRHWLEFCQLLELHLYAAKLADVRFLSNIALVLTISVLKATNIKQIMTIRLKYQHHDDNIHIALKLQYSKIRTKHTHTHTHTYCFKPISQLRFDYDMTMIRRYHDTFDYDRSDQNYNLRSIRLQYDCDEKLTFIFCSHRIMSNGSRHVR